MNGKRKTFMKDQQFVNFKQVVYQQLALINRTVAMVLDPSAVTNRPAVAGTLYRQVQQLENIMIGKLDEAYYAKKKSLRLPRIGGGGHDSGYADYSQREQRVFGENDFNKYFNELSKWLQSLILVAYNSGYIDADATMPDSIEEEEEDDNQ